MDAESTNSGQRKVASRLEHNNIMSVMISVMF